MLRRPFFALVVHLVLVLVLAPSLTAQTAWTTIPEGAQTSLARLDLSSAVAEQLVTLPIQNPGAMAQASGTDLFVVSRSPSPTLYRIETATFSVAEIGPLGLSVASTLRDMAADLEGNIYLIGHDFEVEPSLYRIDRLTGQATRIGPTERPILALAADADRLLGVAIEAGIYSLYEIDPSTAAISLVRELPGADFSTVIFMAKGPDEKLILLSDATLVIAPPASDHRLYSIDLATGEVLLIDQDIDPELRPYRGFVIIDGTEIVAVPALGSGLPIFIALLIAVGLAAIRARL